MCVRASFGTKCLTPKTGIILYKSLVRPCWEFAMAAWVMMPDCGIKKLEQVQARCLRHILETKAHSATDTIEVIANVTPVRLCIQQLCALEYTRIMCKPPEFHLHKMLQEAALKHSDATPLRFLIHP